MKSLTRAQRKNARAKLMKKYWGNAYMGERPGDDIKTISFRQLQQQRRDAWEHGMKEGFAAGIRLAKTAGKKP